MRLRERPTFAALDDAPAPHEAAPQTVDAWLDVFDRLLRLPGAQKNAIREELRSHLTDRVRDLVLAGEDREHAMRQAVSELGEAAELAERFRHANRFPRRRLIMNGALIGLGAAAIVTAAMVTTGQNQTVESAIFDVPERQVEHVDTLKSVNVRIAPDMSLRQIFGVIGDSEQLAVSVNWSALEDWGVSVDEPLGLSAATVSAHQILGELDRRFDEWDRFDWRLEGRMLSIDSKEALDLRERILASYDIEPIVNSMLDRYDVEYEWATAEIASVIQELVEPEQWRENGGSIAQLRIVSGRMFVQAPLRMHEKVAWILGELAKDGTVDDKPQARARAAEPDVMPNPTAEERAGHARVQRSMSQLRNIYMACQIWAHSEQQPLGNLGQLVSAGMLTNAMLKSPDGPVDGGDYWIDFSMLNLPAEVDLSKRIAGIDRAMYAGSTHVATVFADGHVEMLSAERLTALLKQPPNEEVKPDLPARKHAAEELKAVRMHQFAHSSAEELAGLLQTAMASRSEIAVDPRTNTLLLAAPESHMEAWTVLLGRLDQRDPGR